VEIELGAEIGGQISVLHPHSDTIYIQTRQLP